jgi:hypothetical protein
MSARRRDLVLTPRSAGDTAPAALEPGADRTLQSEVSENPFLELADTASRRFVKASAATAGAGRPLAAAGAATSTGDATGDWEQPRPPGARPAIALPAPGHGRRRASQLRGAVQRGALASRGAAPPARHAVPAIRPCAGWPRHSPTGSTNEGYLREEDEEIARRVGAIVGLVARAMALLQRCEPCRHRRARPRRMPGAVSWPSRTGSTPRCAACSNNLPLLAKADWPALMRLCGVSTARIWKRWWPSSRRSIRGRGSYPSEP